MVNFINPGGGHPLGIGEIPYTKVYQVDASCTGRTVQGMGPLCMYISMDKAGLYRAGPLCMYISMDKAHQGEKRFFTFTF